MKIHTCQQQSEEWYALRVGIPTASEFSKIVTSTGERSKQLNAYAMQLAAERYAGIDLNRWGGNLSTDRGRFLEEAGLQQYAFERDADIIKVGFITDDECSYGCSPDAFVGTHGLAEVKCLNAEKHVAAILRWQEKGDSPLNVEKHACPPDYIQQTQGQLLITGRQWCDLIFYHPKLPMLVIRQTAIPAVQSGLLEGIADLLAERDRIHAALIACRDGVKPPDDLDAEIEESMADWAKTNPIRTAKI